MVSRHVPAQVRAVLLVAFVLDGPILVEKGHQVTPVVRNKNVSSPCLNRYFSLRKRLGDSSFGSLSDV
jgi:hypothetical protein